MGADMKSLRGRIRSVDSTLHLTKAMGLVASSKIRKATRNMNRAREYTAAMEEVMAQLRASPDCARSPYMQPRGRGTGTRIIVIAGDRGLAGSYNSNIFKRVDWDSQDADCRYITIGRKACEYFRRKGAGIVSETERVEGLTIETCEAIAKRVMEGYDSGEYDEIVLAYTSFVSVLTQKTKLKPLLPLDAHDAPEYTSRQMLCEPDADTLLKYFMPQYLAGLIYAAACDSFASEQAARRVAMDSATKNAGEMIEDLSLRYNRARQSSITQELTEIVAGAEH